MGVRAVPAAPPTANDKNDKKLLLSIFIDSFPPRPKLGDPYDSPAHGLTAY